METTEIQSMNKMGVEPINKLLIIMGLPMIFSMMLQAFYNVVDSYFVSQMSDSTGMVANLGEYGVNALTLAFPIQMLMISLGVGTGVGINALLSRSLGQNDRKRASRIAGNAIFLGFCLYVLFLLVGAFGVTPYMKSQTGDSIVLGMGTDYLQICTMISFGLMLFTIYEKLLQASGRTGLSMIAQVAGALTNIVMDPIMIFGLFGCPVMGVKGAAYATVIGQIVSFVIAFTFHYTLNKDVDHSPRYMKPNGRLILQIYKIGLPAAVMQALVSVMSYGINIIFGMVGGSVVTAYGIYYKIQQFILFAVLGLNNALIPVIGFNYGRQDKTRMRTAIKYGLIYGVSIMLIGAILLQLFARRLAGIFSLSPETEALCILAMRIVTCGYIFTGFNMSFEAIYQAFGDGVKSLFISLTRLVMTLFLAWMLTKTGSPGNYVWFALPLAEATVVFVSIGFFKKYRTILKVETSEQSPSTAKDEPISQNSLNTAEKNSRIIHIIQSIK